MNLHWVRPEDFGAEQRRIAEMRLEKLAREHDDLVDVRIAARPTEHHRHGGQEVRITCEARRKDIVAARTRADAGLALNEALDAFEREVRRMRDRRGHGRVERRAEPV
jgi:ribosome-associated translation inhibitor RaiA